MRVILMYKDGRHKFILTPRGGYGEVIKEAVPRELDLTSWIGSLEPVEIEPIEVITFRQTHEQVLGPFGGAQVYREIE